MWQLPDEVLGLLQTPSNGAHDRPRSLPRRSQPDWNGYLNEIEQYRGLADDYDGQALVAPTNEVIELAASATRQLSRADLAVPTYSTVGPNGGINIAWEFDNGVSVSLEVNECGEVEVILLEPGNPRHWILQHSVAA